MAFWNKNPLEVEIRLGESKWEGYISQKDLRKALKTGGPLLLRHYDDVQEGKLQRRAVIVYPKPGLIIKVPPVT